MYEISQDKKKVLQESEKFLMEQIENNKQVQDSIKKLERELTTMKEEQGNMKEMITSYENQVRIDQVKVLLKSSFLKSFSILKF